MAIANKNFRENCDRALYVSGEINQDVVRELTPTINKLRLSSSDPITVYIDSPGGSVQHAEIIRQLVKAPNPDGHSCRLIAVLTGTAASAAADFLALGDYSIAYQHATILYHGSRQPTQFALTYEGASSLAQSLQRTNEYFAVRLARSVFPRFVLRLMDFPTQLRDYKEQPGNDTLHLLIAEFARKFDGDNAQMLHEGFSRQEVIANLNTSINKHMGRKNLNKLNVAEFEAEILRGIIKHKIKLHAGDGWMLRGGGLEEISDDFRLLVDFYFGSQNQDLVRQIDLYGPLFLPEKEVAEYKSLVGEEASAWLKEHAQPRLRPLWYFAVSVCRLLQTADYVFTPEEAFWLGLVDEVPGSGLVSLRELTEGIQEVEATQVNPSKAPPP